MKLTKQAALLAVLCIAWLGVAGCQKTEQAKEQTSNGEIKVELLFEHEGVKVYRFYDDRTVYYTDARGKTAWDETHSTGKSSWREHHGVDTAR